MNRRHFLLSLLGLSATTLLSRFRLEAQPAPGSIDDPYAGVDWDQCRYIHSMTHQHGGTNTESLQSFYDMGYRHFNFSNYYPSAPTYPLPADFAAQHPDVIAAPNAEHHSFLDAGLHANAPGSLLATGYGHMLNAQQMAAAPLVVNFENLNVFNANERPGSGVYRLDVTLDKAKEAAAATGTATLTIEGATECVLKEGFAVKGEVRGVSLSAGSQIYYLRTTAPTIKVDLQYDDKLLRVTQFRLMQGSNRPWRDVFRAALDGEMVNGQRDGGLQYADGGGITLNHPTGEFQEYAAMLDFDPRVLGIEVWNVLTTGFGSSVGFYDKSPGPHLHFYNLWDELLRSGRRCLGFFVKDHVGTGRGRNVLLLPDLAGMSVAERERTALRAYRNGAFFGSIAPLATNNEGQVASPFDLSEFRFTRIALQRNAAGQPVSVAVSITGNDAAKRPNTQIRFVTDKGIEHVADAAEAVFPLPRDGAKLLRKYVRVEAFAYPTSHNNGEPLTKDAFRAMNVYDISLLHDKRAEDGPRFFGNEQEFPARIPIVDMIFSQPIRFNSHEA